MSLIFPYHKLSNQSVAPSDNTLWSPNFKVFSIYIPSSGLDKSHKSPDPSQLIISSPLPNLPHMSSLINSPIVSFPIVSKPLAISTPNVSHKHFMVKTQNGIQKPKVFSSILHEPMNYKATIKVLEWMKAMDSKIVALVKNGT